MYEHLMPKSTGIMNSFGLHGLGGVGKTQIAMKYCAKFASIYTYIFWIYADTEAKLSGEYESIVKKLRALEMIPASETSTDSVSLFREWLENQLDERWLIIFDNGDNLDTLKPFWPPLCENGSIVLTSRNPEALRNKLVSKGREVEPFGINEGTAFFL